MKKPSVTNRTPFTKNQLRKLTGDELYHLKLTEDETALLREINKERAVERDVNGLVNMLQIRYIEIVSLGTPTLGTQGVAKRQPLSGILLS